MSREACSRTSQIARINTPRLTIRCWHPSDAPQLLEAMAVGLDHLRPWLGWAAREPEPLARKTVRLQRYQRRFLLGRNFAYGIFDADARTVIGGIGSHPSIGAGARELGYWIRADRLRQGLATEAVAAMVRVGFEYERLSRVEIHCDPSNIASMGVPAAAGFDVSITLRNCVRQPGIGPRNSRIWVLTVDAYWEKPIPARLVAVQLELADGRQISFHASGERPAGGFASSAGNQ